MAEEDLKTSRASTLRDIESKATWRCQREHDWCIEVGLAMEAEMRADAGEANWETGIWDGAQCWRVSASLCTC